MKPIELFSVIGITLTALLGIYNLWINIKSQRKSQRELIFNKQIEFFMQLQSIIAEFEDNVIDFNESHSDIKVTREKIYKLSNEIDLLITKNELIIPDDLFSEISKYSIDCHKLSSLSYGEPFKINKEIKNVMMKKNVSLLDDIREYIGIERLSEENRKLVGGKYKNSGN